MGTVIHNGQEHLVTDAWYQEYVTPWPHLATMESAQCEAERTRLLNLSNTRALSRPERDELEAVTHHCNVRNALKFLDGRPHDDFGFVGADQIHGNRWTPECGCQLHVVFDHHHVMTINAANEVIHHEKLHAETVGEKGHAHAESVESKGRLLKARQQFAHHAKLHGLKNPNHEEAALHELRLHPHTPHTVCEVHEPHTKGSLDDLHAKVTSDHQPA